MNSVKSSGDLETIFDSNLPKSPERKWSKVAPVRDTVSK